MVERYKQCQKIGNKLSGRLNQQRCWEISETQPMQAAIGYLFSIKLTQS
jgi:hypothetical protein